MKRNRWAALLLAAAVLFTALSSAAFLALHADHDCAGEDCPVCERLAACIETLRLVGLCAAAAATAFVCVRRARERCFRRQRALVPRTPVSLRVKLSD